MFKNPLRLGLFSLLFLLGASATFAQIDLRENYEMKKGFLYMKERKIEFGIIKEEDGVQSGEFIAWNIAKDPLVISNVSVACGCTKVTYDKDTLMPGDSVVFYVSYDPTNQKGKFEKAIFIYNTGMPYQLFLTIKGEVIPREKTVLDKYSMNLGNLRMTSSYHDFGFLYEDDVDTFTIGIYNSGTNDIRIKGITGRPAYIILNSQDLNLEPGEESTIEIVYDARQVHDYGDMIHYLTLVTSDLYAPEIPLNINAHLLERFPKQSRRRVRRNPKVAFNEKEYNFGRVVKGDTVKTTFVMRNEGKNPLIIRKIQPSCGCTASKVDKWEIPAGDSATIEIEFNTLGREGEDLKTLTIITNDPAHPVSKIYLKGTIVENPNAL